MNKFHKIGIFIAVFVIFLASSILFIPSFKKEISPEITQKEPIENPIESSNEDIGKEDKIETKKNDSDQPAEVKSEAGKSTDSKETTDEKDKLSIKQKFVSWGYKESSGRTIDTIIIHSSYNALDGDKYSTNKLIEEYKEYGVSPHYLIDREGNVYQLVADKNIAYHAGESKMPDGRSNVNNFSLGIEIMTTENESPTSSQYSALKDLINYIKNKHKISYILGHKQIAPGRKTDPWNFDWSKINL